VGFSLCSSKEIDRQAKSVSDAEIGPADVSENTTISGKRARNMRHTVAEPALFAEQLDFAHTCSFFHHYEQPLSLYEADQI
jgi:hypothetical protein